MLQPPKKCSFIETAQGKERSKKYILFSQLIRLHFPVSTMLEVPGE